ncbi:MAG: GNAT family N-acetyltransferase [Actinocatenispora sp.]
MTESRTATIRIATMDDLPGYLESSAALFAEDAGTRDPDVDTDFPRRHRDLYAANLDADDRLVLLADHDGAIVGHLSGVLQAPSAFRPVPVAELRAMYVRPQHRGSGLGSLLVQGFLDWARRRDAKRASVTAYASNESAIRFYRRHGLQPHEVVLETEL